MQIFSFLVRTFTGKPIISDVSSEDIQDTATHAEDFEPATLISSQSQIQDSKGNYKEIIFKTKLPQGIT